MATKILSYIMDHLFFIGIPYSLYQRIRITMVYYKMFIKNLFFGNIIKSDSFLGYKVFSTNYKFIYSIFKITFFKGQYYFNAFKKDKLLILDCGANIGVSSLFFNYIYPNSEIHTFEPNIQVYDYLLKNTKLQKNIFNHKYALSEKSGKLKFYINNDDVGDTTASLNLKSNANLNTHYQVDAIKLSDFIKNNLGGRNIDFIKFNIEGAEEGVIKELYENNYLCKIDRIIFEYHHHIDLDTTSHLSEMLSYLEKSGMNYTFSVTNFRLYKENIVQNLFIYAYKKDLK
ncbi:FkbM family methyltransferase [Candidatus Gracilibacteria bacterium]|nr:FkbM family methyltransferase [Candidatus Gracilibacteria bacterium]